MQDPVLILGASGAIGSAIARRLHADRVGLIVHGRMDSPRLATLASDLGAPAVSGDLTDESAAEALALEVRGISEGLSGLVFSAAAPFPHKLALRTEWGLFQAQIDSQLKALHIVMQQFKPQLEKREGGARVLILSTEYVLGVPPVKIAPYLVAKAALTMYAKVLAQELLTSGIRIHILAPGLVKSALTADMPDEYLEMMAEEMPERKLTSAEDVAAVSAFLMRPEADPLMAP